MANNAILTECGVCNEEFNEEAKCPSIFLCSHTFCTSCTDQLIESNTRKCPFCHKTKPATKERVPPLKKIIENLKKEIRETSSLYLVNSQEAEKQIEKTLKEVTNLEKNIKEENSRIKNDILTKIQNVISQNNRVIGELDRTKNKLENQLKEVKDKDMQLKKMKGNLNSCTATTFSEAAALLDEAEKTNTVISCWTDNFKGIISEEKKARHTTEKAIKRIKEKINIILEVLNSEKEREEEEVEEEVAPISGMAAMAIQEANLPTQITSETLREMSAQVKRLVDQGRIYAIQHHGGRRRYARISYSEDEKLCLHHLREEPLPSNICFVDHENVMSLVDPSAQLVFIELGVGSSTLGRLYIRLHSDNKRAKQFVFLCTGEKGPSYANTNFLRVENKGDVHEYVRGGDYECNDGEGGKALVPRVWEEKESVYERPWLVGSVEGSWHYESWRIEAIAAQFDINTKDIPERALLASLGMVEEGLSILTEAISDYRNIKEVLIKDCGIVLHL